MKNLTVREIIFISLFASLTGVLGLVLIPLPFTPVPITLQTLGVMLAGLVLGKKNGALSMIIFLLLGAAGAPVFSGGRAGLGMLAGPSGGYILSWPIAAWVIGWLVEKIHRPKVWAYLVAAVAGGIVPVHFLGVIQLSLVTHLPLQAALIQGTLLFIPGDLLKAVGAALLAPRLRAVMRK